MISWGLEVNDDGNAALDGNGDFIKIADQGVTEPMWAKMKRYAADKGWKGGNYKKLNLPFENKLQGLPREIRDRMEQRVESFVYNMLVNVFNAQDTADLAIETILETNGFDPGPKAKQMEDPEEWTPEKIAQRAALIVSNESPEGNFDD
jgi:fructose-bisphosphate aldolase class II